MEPVLSSSPRLLLVEADDALQSLLTEVLRDVGYAVSLASSLEEALVFLNQETFVLVLADVFVGRPYAGSFTPAHQLRRKAHPTPVGLLMTVPFSPEEAERAGFAFVLPMPFDLDGLLAEVARATEPFLSDADEQHIQAVERFFAAREREDWPALLALCTEDVAYYLFAPAGVPLVRQVQGTIPVQHALAAIARKSSTQLFLHRYYARLPKGLVVRYVRLWTTPEGERRREAKVALFHFRGAQIAQFGMHPLLPGREAQTHVG